jgi:hypothetical protein
MLLCYYVIMLLCYNVCICYNIIFSFKFYIIFYTLEDLKCNKIIEMTHKSVDFKSSSVQHYLENNKSMDNVCHIFGCAKSFLKRWVDRYSETKNITRRNRAPIAYKINNSIQRQIIYNVCSYVFSLFLLQCYK